MKHLTHTARGFVIASVLASCLAAAAQGVSIFTSTGSLNTAREAHTATLLLNGNVLVVGGKGGGGDLSSAELYNPTTGTWSPTGSLPGGGIRDFTATLLPNGKVLVAGGAFGSPGYTGESSAADLYDPATGTWSATGSLHYNYSGHTATLLPNGKVLVVGDTAELYNPATGTWTITGSLATARAAHTATLLSSGKVLVTAGNTGYFGDTNGAELYNPATGAWSSTGSLANPRDSHTATLLPNGKVLVTGGLVNTYTVLASAEQYDPTTGTWSSTGNLGIARYGHTATKLPNGKVLVVGGVGTNSSVLASAELYDPATGAWSPVGGLSDARVAHTATLLSNGQLLVAGGMGTNGILNTAELSNPKLSLLNPILNQSKLGDGSIQFGFTTVSGLTYHVLASPNPAAPINTWSNLGNAIETPPGSSLFQFIDHQATNYPHRFYRVTSP